MKAFLNSKVYLVLCLLIAVSLGVTLNFVHKTQGEPCAFRQRSTSISVWFINNQKPSLSNTPSSTMDTACRYETVSGLPLKSLAYEKKYIGSRHTGAVNGISVPGVLANTSTGLVSALILGLGIRYIFLRNKF